MNLIAAYALTLPFLLAAADLPKAPPLLPPDERYKADLLLIIAHPDDDVVIGGYLAKISLDDHKRVAVIYCTSGDGGGNAVGYEAGAALGQLRILEARKALSFLGIDNVWFLAGHDTPGQDVLWSLDNWNHGRALDEIVRLVRITRPDVILTWLPNYVVGENHDDHQAAGVLATEAFDLAGDPTRFSEQISPPRDRVGMMNLTEGLHTWQPQKLYYFSDAFEDFGPYWHDEQQLSPFRKNFLDGNGPSYPNTAISPTRNKSYARLTAEHQVYYQTQEGYLGKDALEKNDLSGFEFPTRLLFGKSVVGGNVTGDVFDGVKASPVPFAPVKGFVPTTHDGLWLELDGPWSFYRGFWSAHDLEHIAKLITVPEAAVQFGKLLHVPLVLHNWFAQPADIKLSATLPAGWVSKTSYELYPLKPGESYPIVAAIEAPASGSPHWVEITWQASSGSKTVSSITMHVFVGRSGGLPQ